MIEKLEISSIQLDAIEREACQDSLYEFFLSFWEEVSEESLVDNWHIEKLCNELEVLGESVVQRSVKLYDLIINISPGTTKSTIVSVVFPVWLWIKDPTIRIISNSYSSSLSIELATKSRDIIYSDKFRRLFPEVVIRQDKSAKQAYENTKGGARYTTSTGGTIMGKHAHIILNDDPLNPKQAASDADRKTANEHTKTLSTRKINKKNTPIVTIMQRLHKYDVTGYLLSKKKNTRHIKLPAEITENNKPIPSELEDYYVDGLMDPLRLDREVLAEAKIDLGSYGYANQYDQNAAPQEGGILKTKWFDIIDWLPEYHNLIWNTVIDSAYTADKKNDESGFLVWAEHNNNILVRHAQGVYLEFPQLVKETKTYPSLHGYTNKSKIEVEPKASGKSLVQQVSHDTKLNILEGETPIKDKVGRANDISPKCEAKRVKLIRGEWNEVLLDEIRMFPKGGTQDGLVDCLIMICLKLDAQDNYTGIKIRRKTA